METVVNFFHSTADNVGDQMCGPAQYLWPKRCKNVALGNATFGSVTAAIVGGGQIFSQMGPLAEAIHRANNQAKIVAWGVGLPAAGRRDRLVKQVSESFAAFGTRNYDRKNQYTFVPCASCLSNLFDQIEPPRYEVVAYLHRKKDGPLGVPDSIPTMSNAMRPPSEVISFIASGETVVTSSYHGVYWAQLLGRRVVCLPYNEKFNTFQHLPLMVDPKDWQGALVYASRTEPLLEEYRTLNYAFAERAMEIWNG